MTKERNQTKCSAMSEGVLFGMVTVMFLLIVAALLLTLKTNALEEKLSQVEKEALHINASTVVVFDSQRYLNARRTAIRELMIELGEKGEEATNPAAKVGRLDKMASKVIEEKAGGKLVIARRALALPEQAKDITDEVILALDLPLPDEQ